MCRCLQRFTRVFAVLRSVCAVIVGVLACAKSKRVERVGVESHVEGVGRVELGRVEGVVELVELVERGVEVSAGPCPARFYTCR